MPAWKSLLGDQPDLRPPVRHPCKRHRQRSDFSAEDWGKTPVLTSAPSLCGRSGGFEAHSLSKAQGDKVLTLRDARLPSQRCTVGT